MEKDLNQGMCPQRVRNLVQGKRTSTTITTSNKDNSVNRHAGETESRQTPFKCNVTDGTSSSTLKTDWAASSIAVLNRL